MAKSNYYSELLLDPRWQKLRLEVMQRDEFTCIYCGDKENTLNVHHKEYKYGKKPWEYDISDLETTCASCHKGISENLKASMDILKSYFWLGSDILLNLLKSVSGLYPDKIEMLSKFSEFIVKSQDLAYKENHEGCEQRGLFGENNKYTEKEYSNRTKELLLQMITEYLQTND